MALSNVLWTVMGLGAVYLLFRGDVKDSASIFKRNVRQIRSWIEEESAAASKNSQSKPKEIEPQNAEKSIPKDKQ